MLRSRCRCCISLPTKSHLKLVYKDSTLEETMGEHKKIKLKNESNILFSGMQQTMSSKYVQNSLSNHNV
jgi:hypothetical protein